MGLKQKDDNQPELKTFFAKSGVKVLNRKFINLYPPKMNYIRFFY